MPELKHTFTSGRMNKDLDERLVPNGEYRDALNVEVLTSEGSNMGTVQSCLGNLLTSDLTPDGESTCVGSVVDDKTNKAYYFIAGKPPSSSSVPSLTAVHVVSSDLIVEYNSVNNETLPVIVDIYNVRTEITNRSVSTNGDLIYTVTSTDGLRVGMEVRYSGGLATQQTPYPIITSIPTSTTVVLSRHIRSTGTTALPQLPLKNVNFTSGSIDDCCGPGGRVLNFHKDRLITGVNIVDDMLFWTDNFSEPKKVNITRGKQGSISAIGICQACSFNHNSANSYTYSNILITGTTHTELVLDEDVVTNLSSGGTLLNPPFGIPEYLQEKHITVIKKSPLTPPNLEMSSDIQRLDANGTVNPTSGQISQFMFYGTIAGVTSVYEVGTTSQQVNSDPAGNDTMIELDSPADFRAGDVLECSDSLGGPVKIKLVVTSSDSTSTNPVLVSSPTNGNLEVKIIFVSDLFLAEIDNNTTKTWYIELKPKEDSLYELKFPKFGYRYKYEDGEYSAFSPFSEIAFLPSEFDYHPKKGYNLGMTNNLKKLVVKDFIPPNIPLDVIEIDILYKESNSPNIYTIRTFDDEDPEWNTFGTGEYRGKFEIKDDLIHAVVASNQILRPWDNVPRKALGQEITGNRLVYGNYLQNYNLISNTDKEVKPEFELYLDSDPVEAKNFPEKSLKSVRTYQLGIVYKDVYGRETPVITHPSGVIKVEHSRAAKANSLAIKTISPPPFWANSFKYFVKEVSNEYYNLAMDRWYDAEDEGCWLSFPSEDRNKVDEETTLILKKGVGQEAEAVEEYSRYKILAIKNEAPDFIKTTEEILATFDANTTAGSAGHFIGFPLLGVKNITIKEDKWEESELASLQHKTNQQSLYSSILGDKDTSLQMRVKTGNNAHHSDWYDIINITYKNSGTKSYKITVTETFGDDMVFTSTGNTGDTAIADLFIEIRKKIVENKPEFDGRFFVKIHDDRDQRVFETHVKSKADATARIIQGQKLFYYMGYNSTQDPQNPNVTFGQDLKNSFGDHYTSVTDDSTYGEDFLAYEIGAVSGGGTGVFTNPTTNNPYPRYSDLEALQPTRGDDIRDFYTQELNLTNDGSGNAIQPGNPFASSDAGSSDEGGWWFIDQEPTYRLLGTTPGTGSTYGAELVALTSDTGVGAVEGNDQIDISWIGTRNWPFKQTSGDTWKDIGGLHKGEAAFIQRISQPGKIFRFIDDPDNIEYEIGSVSKTYHLNNLNEVGAYNTIHEVGTERYQPQWTDFRVRWSLKLIEPGSKDPVNNPNGTPMSLFAGNYSNGTAYGGGYIVTNPPNSNASPEGPGANDCIDNMGTTNITRAGIEFVEPYYDQKQDMPSHPAIWETEPKENVGLDIYYEIGQAYPVSMCDGTEELYIQPGATVSMHQSNVNGTYTLSGWEDANAVIDGIAQTGANATSYTGTLTTILPSIHTTSATTTTTTDTVYGSSFPNIEFIVLNNPNNNLITVGLGVTDSAGLIPSGTTVVSITLVAASQNQMIELSQQPTSAIPPGTVLTFTGIPLTDQITTTIPTVVTSITGCAGKVPNGSTQKSTLLELNNGQVLNEGDVLSFTNPDGTTVTATVAFDTQYNFSAFGSLNTNPPTFQPQNQIYLNALAHGENQTLPYYNCYTFGNGVESNRIRDLYNAVTIDKGVKASTTLAEQYKEEYRKSGLIFSGIYNSMNGVNRLNQFIMAENITKDLNPEHGSIQKLHQRDTDLITLCEDKVLKVLANKDALFNADDTKNITATKNVLGNAIPFVGEYGISKNPESFASESFRAYFTDKQRGAVLRLSRDGLTPISEAGMTDWFADNLRSANKIIGSYDSKKSLYNVTLKDYTPRTPNTLPPRPLDIVNSNGGLTEIPTLPPRSTTITTTTLPQALPPSDFPQDITDASGSSDSGGY